MLGTDTLVWVLTGVVTLVGSLSGIIWKLVRDEAKGQAEILKEKADNDRVTELEHRFQAEISEAKADTEKLVNKLEAKHDKEIDQLSARLTDQIRSTETNILTQLRLMIEMVRKQETR